MDITGTKGSMAERLLDATSLRQKVLANNIANQNTPGFRRQEVQFEQLLQRAMRDAPELAATLEPIVVVDNHTQAGTDGNNVKLEGELNMMRESRILYETYAAVLQGRFELIRSSIQSR